MAIDLHGAMTAFVTVLLVAAFSATAATGRIAFSGAIAEPTCSAESTSSEATPLVQRPVFAPHRQTCGRTRDQPGCSYSNVVTRLDTANAGSDRLLAYFVGYANSGGAATTQATLVVRTYE
jgi:type 1 fimbria pilin